MGVYPAVTISAREMSTMTWRWYLKFLDVAQNGFNALSHWGRVTHICVSKLTIISSDNSLSSNRRQAIIWTNAGIFLFGPLGTNFSEIVIEIHAFSFKKIHLKMSSAKWRPCCLGLKVLRHNCKFRAGGGVEWWRSRLLWWDLVM